MVEMTSDWTHTVTHLHIVPQAPVDYHLDDPSLSTNLVRDPQETTEKQDKSSWELLKSAGEERDVKNRHWKIIRLKKLLEQKLKKKLKDSSSSSYSKNEFKPSPKI